MLKWFKKSRSVHIPAYHWDDNIDRWVLDEEYHYHSDRYNKDITIKLPYTSNGADGAFDILSAGWWVHDWLCDGMGYDNGTQPTNWEASNILHDILKSEGYWARAEYWRQFTYWFGGEKLKKK